MGIFSPISLLLTVPCSDFTITLIKAFRIPTGLFLVAAIATFLSLAGTFAAISLWPMRQSYLIIKRSSLMSLHQLARSLFLLVRKLHPYLGWLTFAAVAVHSLYFLLYAYRPGPRTITGIIAWFILSVLVALGVWLILPLKKKPYFKNVKLWHMTIATLFFFAMVFHVLYR